MNCPVPVVICDDSRMARKQMASALRGWNVEVTFAEHGLEGIEAVRAGKGDILFLDLNMPIMDGYQVLERIRRDDLPTMVIVISGDIQPEAQKRVLELGALAFIRKPTSAETIADVLNQFGLLSEIQHADEIDLTDSEVLSLPDFYQEVSNVAMGQAGAMLAKLLDTFVPLPIPKVEVIGPDALNELLVKAVDGSDLISQGFVGSSLAGEVLLVLEHDSLDKVAQALGQKKGAQELSQTELLMTLANALSGAFISSFAKQIDLCFSRSTPQIVYDFTGLPEDNRDWGQTLMISLNYKFEDHDIHCDLMMIFTEDSLPKLQSLTSYLQ